MKIYLINLPSPFLVHERVHMPLGLMYLHEYLTVNGIEVPEIVDLAGIPEDKWNIPADGEYYGISATTPQYPIAVKVAQKIKEQNPEAKTVLGGIHATAMDDCHKDFDIIIKCEGEKTLLDICNMGSEYQYPLIHPDEKNIDNFPHPKLSSINADSYTLKQTYCFQGKVVERNAGWLLTSRGCHHNCRFCASKCMWNGKVRFHSMAYLEEWVEYWIARGINNFHFVDEQIAFNQKRLEDICKLMKRTMGYWKCLTRGDSVTSDRAKMMYAAGCRQLIIGVETGSQRLLDLVNKKEKVEDNENAVKIAHENGMGVKASVMVGLPTETQEDVDLTAELLERSNPDEVGIFTFIPNPGCDIYDNPEKYDYKIKEANWEDYVCIDKTNYTSTLEEGKDEIIKKRKQQLIDVVGDNYILNKHKERWGKWHNS